MPQQGQVRISQQLIWGTLLVIVTTQERLGEPPGGMQWRRERRQVRWNCWRLESGKAQGSPQNKAAPPEESHIPQEQACLNLPAELHWRCGFSENMDFQVQLQRRRSVPLPTVDPRGHCHNHCCWLNLTFHYPCVCIHLPLSSGQWILRAVLQ